MGWDSGPKCPPPRSCNGRRAVSASCNITNPVLTQGSDKAVCRCNEHVFRHRFRAFCGVFVPVPLRLLCSSEAKCNAQLSARCASCTAHNGYSPHSARQLGAPDSVHSAHLAHCALRNAMRRSVDACPRISFQLLSPPIVALSLGPSAVVLAAALRAVHWFWRRLWGGAPHALRGLLQITELATGADPLLC